MPAKSEFVLNMSFKRISYSENEIIHFRNKAKRDKDPSEMVFELNDTPLPQVSKLFEFQNRAFSHFKVDGIVSEGVFKNEDVQCMLN